ncbi:hypothetical protein ACH5RR_021751 [Cinchona calisaya]|uniref:Uncharacterized protein n=1 Tax=Cinchona calisaya TaxID=153742 RepID=A0ABD2ZI87_9GENT
MKIQFGGFFRVALCLKNWLFSSNLPTIRVRMKVLETLTTSYEPVFKSYFSNAEEVDSVFPEVLPLTFIEHLKEIEISNFKGEEHKLKLDIVIQEVFKGLPDCVKKEMGLDKVHKIKKGA